MTVTGPAVTLQVRHDDRVSEPYNLAGLALRMFVELDPVAQRDALEYIEQLRNRSEK